MNIDQDTGIETHPYSDTYRQAIKHRRERRIQRQREAAGLPEDHEETPKWQKKRQEKLLENFGVV
jgi:hypothetical protein